MKVVDLNRRYTMHRKYGFAVRLEFDETDWFDTDTKKEYERYRAAARQLFGEEFYRHFSPTATWASDWENARVETWEGKRRRFYIYLRNRSQSSMLLLAV